MGAIGEGFKLANNVFDLFTKDVWEKIDSKRREAIEDVGKCRDALLKDDYSTVQLLCDGLVRELPCYLTSDQRIELEKRTVENVDKLDVLALYHAAREGKYKHEKIELLTQAFLEKNNV